MSRLNSPYQEDKGFTIVELLVAITVFSLILVVVSAGLIQAGRMYYRANIVSRTQNINRGIVDEFSRGLQFSGSRPHIELSDDGVNLDRICFSASTRYSIELDAIVGTDEAYAIALDSPGPGCPSVESGDLENAIELLGDNMQLTNLSIERLSNTDNYRIYSRIIYGDEDLIIREDREDGFGERKYCKTGTVGVEFCAVSELTTTVTRRLTGE